MQLNSKSLEKLRNLINEETEYRSGPKLIEFFSDLGFNDSYGQGFPSRWKYTDERLNQINGRPEIDSCIRKLFAPVNFIGRTSELDHHITDFNQYLAFDGWQVVRDHTNIKFQRASEITLHNEKTTLQEDDFLGREFGDISFSNLNLDGTIITVLNSRFEEIKKDFSAKAYLSMIIMAGSTMEGALLGISSKHPREFNQAKASPKDKDGKVKILPDWTLSNFIDVASELGFLKEDVKKFSHVLRDFRNYIHPFQQMSSGFFPDEHTAKICLQVLKAAIYQLSSNKLS